MSRFYGLLPTVPDPRDYRFRAPQPYRGTFVDLSAGFKAPGLPYDQGQLGSCVSQGTAAIVDYARAKQGLGRISPSRLFIYWNGRKRGGYPLNQDTGLQIRDGLDVVANDGAPPETDWPYQVDRFTEQPPAQAYDDGRHDLATVYGQVDDIDATVASGYPVVQGFTVFESFESDEVARTGIVPMPEPGEAELGGHCTVIVSTPKIVDGVPSRLHLNSWGSGWGQGGFYWAPVAFTDRYASDFWMVTTMSDPNGPTPPPVDPDRAFASVLKPWVSKRHLTLTGAHQVATAGKAWLKTKGL